MDNVNQPATGGSKTGMWVALVLAIAVLGVGAYFLLARDNGTNANNANVVVNQNTNSSTNQNINDNSNVNAASNVNGGSNSNITNGVDNADLLYENSQLEFTLQFPNSWIGYSATSYINTSPTGEARDYSTVLFEHPKKVSDTGLPGKVGFSVSVFENPDTVIPVGTTIVKTNGSVRYGWARGNAAVPGDLSDLDLQIEDIISTLTTE